MLALPAAVSPHTERCAAWLAVRVRTGETIQRSAHINVANCKPGALVRYLWHKMYYAKLSGKPNLGDDYAEQVAGPIC